MGYIVLNTLLLVPTWTQLTVKKVIYVATTLNFIKCIGHFNAAHWQF